MKYPNLAEKILSLQNADLSLRNKLIQEGKLSDGYDSQMEELHNKNADILQKIIDQIGYPTIEKVGKEANEAAWLVIQHAISKPEFMKNCLILLKKAVEKKEANPQHVAYLTDRIAVFENRPQKYGTSFDWNEKGELNPLPFDNLNDVNQRRKLLNLNTLEEQIELLRKRAVEENEKPPRDYQKRQKECDEWKKRVGWIT